MSQYWANNRSSLPGLEFEGSLADGINRTPVFDSTIGANQGWGPTDINPLSGLLTILEDAGYRDGTWDEEATEAWLQQLRTLPATASDVGPGSTAFRGGGLNLANLGLNDWSGALGQALTGLKGFDWSKFMPDVLPATVPEVTAGSPLTGAQFYNVVEDYFSDNPINYSPEITVGGQEFPDFNKMFQGGLSSFFGPGGQGELMLSNLFPAGAQEVTPPFNFQGGLSTFFGPGGQGELLLNNLFPTGAQEVTPPFNFQEGLSTFFGPGGQGELLLSNLFPTGSEEVTPPFDFQGGLSTFFGPGGQGELLLQGLFPSTATQTGTETGGSPLTGSQFYNVIEDYFSDNPISPTPGPSGKMAPVDYQDFSDNMLEFFRLNPDIIGGDVTNITQGGNFTDQLSAFFAPGGPGNLMLDEMVTGAMPQLPEGFGAFPWEEYDTKYGNELTQLFKLFDGVTPGLLGTEGGGWGDFGMDSLEPWLREMFPNYDEMIQPLDDSNYTTATGWTPAAVEAEGAEGTYDSGVDPWELGAAAKPVSIIDDDIDELSLPSILDYTQMIREPLIGGVLDRLGAANPFDTRRDAFLEGAFSPIDRLYKEAEENLISKGGVLNKLGTPGFRGELRELYADQASKKAEIGSQFDLEAARGDEGIFRNRLADVSNLLAGEWGRTKDEIGLQADLMGQATDDYYKNLQDYRSAYFQPQDYQDQGLNLASSGLTGAPSTDMTAATTAASGAGASAQASSVNMYSMLDDMFKNFWKEGED